MRIPLKIVEFGRRKSVYSLQSRIISLDKKSKRSAKHLTGMDMQLEKDDTLYVLSYRLPLECVREQLPVCRNETANFNNKVMKR